MELPATSASINLPSQADRSTAADVFDEFRSLWRDGEPIDVNAFSVIHPEIVDDRELFLDLIYEEFQLRRERGDQIEAEVFAERYPDFKSSLGKLAAADQLFEQRPELLNEPTPWPKPGERLLGFRLLRPIGKGSFSHVYLAEDLSIGRDVVVKITREGVGEAKLLSRVKHPNVVEVLSAEDDPLTGFSVVCMPYLGETTLSHILEKAFAGSIAPQNADALLPAIEDVVEVKTNKDKPKPKLQNRNYVDQALALMKQLSGAIASAHAEDIQHRDIKPTNVLITSNGDAKVLDFNLSVDGDQSEATLGGTLPYMSPEQLRATVHRNRSGKGDGTSPLAKSSDVYSLGVLYYELLTGGHPHGPFPSQTTTEQFCNLLQTAVKRKPTPVFAINPNVPRRLSHVIDKCLSADPEQRYADANELHLALTNLTTPRARVKSWASSRVRMLAGGLAAAVCLSAVAVFAWAQQPDAAAKHWNRSVENARRLRLQPANTELAAAFEHGDRSPHAYYLRGRFHMLNGRWSLALADLHHAKKQLRDGRIDVCLAHCYSAGDNPDFALAETYYRTAIRLGFGNAAVYNNLAYCLMMQNGNLMISGRGREPKAPDYLRYAIKLDPTLAAAHYNLALWELRIALRMPEHNPLAGIRAIEIAINLSNPNARNARMLWDAARLYAGAALYARRKNDISSQQVWQSQMQVSAKKAVQLGLPAEFRTNDKFLQFIQISETPARARSTFGAASANSSTLANFVDPLAGLVE